jgi:2-polyprenyl-3-methyl-5-hydroxy-6-metoxy-1,4-benzoquinol methylase
VDPEYATQYSDLYRRHWWWRVRETAILDVIRQIQPAPGWENILDVGCGDGLFFERLQQFGNVEGVEPDASLVRRDGPHRGRIYAVPFDQSFLPEARYSLILMLDVLEHMADPVAALRHARQLLTPDGIILCTVPAFDLLWTSHDELNRHVTRYTKRSFRAVSRSADLEIVREAYLFQWVFAAKLGVRMVERLAGAAPSVPRVPPPWVNALFFRMTLAEYKLLRAWPVPFGSSLLVVAKRHRLGSAGGRVDSVADGQTV